MARRVYSGMTFKRVAGQRQGLSQRVQPVKGRPQRASNANPRRKH